MVVVLGLQSMQRAGEHDRALLGSEVELGYSSELTQELLRFAAAGLRFIEFILLAIPEAIRKPIHTTQITYIYDYIEEYSIDPRSLFIVLVAQELCS